MSQLHHLTLQDMLWIHLQISRRVVPFDYARLEEATFAQYAHGDSTGLLLQAARLGAAFCRNVPFADSNEAVGFVGVVALMELNGYDPTFDDRGAEHAFRKLAADGGVDAIESAFTEGQHAPGHRSLQPTVYSILRRYPETIRNLAAGAPTA